MKSKALAAPYLVWMALFTIVPLAIVAFYAFTDSQTGELTMKNIANLGNYLPILIKSIWLALISSVICLLIGYPVAYYVAGQSENRQRFLYMLVMLPMCISFLLRTLAWVALTEDTGIINNFIVSLGLEPLPLIRNNGAVVLGMVYDFLPFMVLPIYNVLVKMDKSVIEAAYDLGASKLQVLLKVILPMSVPGIVSGVTMVFVPSLTTFVISNMLGGGKINLIGNIIEQEFTIANNWNLGAGLSLIMMIFIVISMAFIAKFDKDGEVGLI